ncbi:EEF1AKNMT [Symbiodinium necroappetens]|uniref:EEF1AKNMT protein n=1 Tax=Symbiodinium necroappetens TaxID=1628268 RepID=A0A813ADG2_9DINO|nr:EEF1AKNMT [Symbiodinium necroappetens]
MGQPSLSEKRETVAMITGAHALNEVGVLRSFHVREALMPPGSGRASVLARVADLRISHALRPPGPSAMSYVDAGWLPPPSESEHSDAEDQGHVDGLPNYGDVHFWTEEWLVSYSHFVAQGWLRFFPSKAARILDLGCGDSEFMSEAYDDGYEDITGVDIVPAVLDTMKQLNTSKRPGIKYELADARELSLFPDGSFDVVFDKSTLDALKCAGQDATSRMSSEIHRILSSDGVYLCVSLNTPEEAQPAIEHTAHEDRGWDVQVLVCENERYDGSDGPPKHLYMYVARKALSKPVCRIPLLCPGPEVPRL